MNHADYINTVLKPLADKPQQAYMSNLLQVADIMQWILEQTGPAAIKMTSFSISSISSGRRGSSPISISCSTSKPPTRLLSYGRSSPRQ